MDSMCCFLGEVPSILHCNCISPIKHRHNWKFWYVCGERSPSISLFSPVALLTPSRYKISICLDTHKRSLLLLAFYLHLEKKSMAAVSVTPSAQRCRIALKVLSTQGIGGINQVNQPVDRLLLK